MEKSVEPFAKKIALYLIDITELCKTIRGDYGFDLNVGDYAVGTNTFEGSIFKVFPRYKPNSKQPKELPNPYQENVVKSSAINITRRANKEDENIQVELRIQVCKINPMLWNETTQSYGVCSSTILFRQKIIDFSKIYENIYNNINFIINLTTRFSNSNVEDAKTLKKLLEELMKVKPFPAFYDDKYGFLVKRQINQVQIVKLNPTTYISASTKLREAVEKNEEMIKDREEKLGDFRADIIAEAMKPERVEKLVNTFGIEAVMSSFE